MTSTRTLAVAAALAAFPAAFGQEPTAPQPPKPTLYVVPYAHLDTQWRWSYPQVVREFLWNTMEDNFRLFDKYPDYVFNFGGSRRFELMREYFPGEYAKVVAAVKAGRWFPAPASVDETECNILSGESVIRNVLYGNLYYAREFGVTSDEFMRPDSFGFPYSLPTLLHHAGIKGFSTQKLTWGSSVGIPFNVGVWTGPDGSDVLAALNATDYGSHLNGDESRDERWIARVTGNPVPVDYRYYGTGDRGGAPAESSVANGEKSVKGDGPLKIVQGPADAMFKALTPDQIAKLPRYRGELLLTQHSAGSLTSHAEMKRWNRANERLADLAERTSVTAALVAGSPYPVESIDKGWDLTLGSQMHDMLPGTCLPKAYEYAQNDEIVAQKTFSQIATNAVAAVAAQLDTQAKGTPLVVVNPLSIERNDVTEAWVRTSLKGSPQVYGPDGKPVLTQVLENQVGRARIAFRAQVPANGFAVFDVRVEPIPASIRSNVYATGRTIRSDRFEVKLNEAGDLASVIDRKTGKEALKAPAGLDLQHENPREYPAWNMDWDDQKKPPYAKVGGPATIKVVESGPVRATIEVTRESHGSKFTRRYSLTQGGDRVEICDDIDWSTRETALKAAFPLTTANPKATYGMQVGAIERGNNEEKKYEVPLHGWMDLTAPDGKYGVAILSTDKFGADKPSDDILRLTLLYTPGTRGGYQDQGVQDFGRHTIRYGLAPHAGDWRTGHVAWNAARLGQPLRAFAVAAHPGRLGRSFSLARVSDPAVEIMALKRAEDGDGYIVRLRELTDNEAGGVGVRFGLPLLGAQEVDGQERPLGAAKVEAGKLIATVPGFGLRSYRVRLGTPKIALPQPVSKPLPLAYDLDVASTRANDGDGEFADGRSLAAETMPETVNSNGVEFRLGPTADGAKNALAAHGQRIAIPEGYDRIAVLTAATADVTVPFRMGDRTLSATIPAWNGYVGQWDTRLWAGTQPELAYDWKLPFDGLKPGYVKPGDLGLVMTHTHAKGKGDAIYDYAYLYRTEFSVPKGVHTLTLPNDPRVRVFAISAVRNRPTARPSLSLMEMLDDRTSGGNPKILVDTDPNGDGATVALQPPLYWHGGSLHYTLDGSAPTKDSPAYKDPIFLAHPATVRVTQVDGDGKTLGTAEMKVEAHDEHPPVVTSTTIFPTLGTGIVTFSERVDPSTAEKADGYVYRSGRKVEKATLRPDGRTVDLVLDTTEKSVTNDETMGSGSVKDLAGNQIQYLHTAVRIAQPVFTAPPSAPGETAHFDKGAPTAAKAPWTLNLWLLMDAQPENETLIAGFGSPHDGSSGAGRYFAKFENGVHFWSAQQDVRTRVPLDVRKWQMLTATYDGSTIRLYKNGKPIAQREVVLSDDSPEVNVLPLDAWQGQRKLNGEVQALTVWDQALPVEAIGRLFAQGRS